MIPPPQSLTEVTVPSVMFAKLYSSSSSSSSLSSFAFLPSGSPELLMAKGVT